MPLIRYKCVATEGHVFSKLFVRSADVVTRTSCPECGLDSVRVLSAPASVSKMVVDNGQARAVEVRPDIMVLRDQMTKTPKNRGD